MRSTLMVLLLACSPAQATLVLDVGPDGFPVGCSGCGTASGATLGWAFSVSTTISIDGLGVWDEAANGFGSNPVDIGLWVDGGPLLATATVTSDSALVDSVSNDGAWRFADIMAVTLTPGLYVIGSVFYDTGTLGQFDTAFSTIAAVDYLGGRQVMLMDSGLSRPDFDLPGDEGFFGPTMRLLTVTEPTAVALFAIGLAMMLWRRRPV